MYYKVKINVCLSFVDRVYFCLLLTPFCCINAMRLVRA